MSRPWRDQLNVSLSPSRLVRGRRVLGWRGWRHESGAVDIAPVADGPAWRGALAALAADLSADRARPARVRLVLSNHFVRYAVVPWRADLRSIAEREGFVRHVFRSVWGESTDGWSLREQPGRHGHASLACAVDRELLEGLRAAFRGTPHRLVGIEPLFMAAFNEHRKVLGERGCFLVAEPGRLCGVAYEGGEWRSAFAVRTGAGPLAPEAIEREALLQDVADDAPRLLCAVEGEVPAEFTRPVKLLAGPARGEHGFAAAWIGCAA